MRPLTEVSRIIPANMGDRLYAEMKGTNKKSDIKRKGSGLAGRLQRGILDGA